MEQQSKCFNVEHFCPKNLKIKLFTKINDKICLLAENVPCLMNSKVLCGLSPGLKPEKEIVRVFSKLGFFFFGITRIL